MFETATKKISFLVFSNSSIVWELLVLFQMNVRIANISQCLQD